MSWMTESKRDGGPVVEETGGATRETTRFTAGGEDREGGDREGEARESEGLPRPPRMPLLLRCLQVGIILSLGSAGLVYVFWIPPRVAGGAPPRTPTQAVLSEAEPAGRATPTEESVTREPASAVSPRYSRLGYATRVFADPATGVFQITREPFLGLEPDVDGATSLASVTMSSEVVAIEATYCEQIPDHFGWGEVEVSEHRYRMAGRDIRILLYKWGPPESSRDFVGDDGLPLPRIATTELTLWIDGKARMIGPLTDSVAEMREMPVFDTVLVQLPGDAIFVRASRREGGISRRGEGQISLLTEPPQIAFPEHLLDEEEPEPVPTSEPTGDVVPDDDDDPSRIALSAGPRPTRPRSRRRRSTREGASSP